MPTIIQPAVEDLSAVEEFCLRWKAAWNAHDADAVSALCSEDLVYDEPALGDTVYGRDAMRAFVIGMDLAMPDHEFELKGLFADLNRRAVLVAWRLTGTHAKTGNPVDFHGDDRLEFNEDGLITAYRCVYDNALVLKQFGRTPR